MIIKQLVFVTSEPRKVREIEHILGIPLRSASLDLVEIQTVDIEEMICAKAQEAYRLLGVPVLVEDTGLYIAAWNKLPGALTKWFLKTVGNEGICQMMSAYSERRAIAKTVIGLHDGTRFESFSGKVQGKIALEPVGEHAFGWDPIFIPEGYTKTFAQMTIEEKSAISMRRMAVQKLYAYLETK